MLLVWADCRMSRQQGLGVLWLRLYSIQMWPLSRIPVGQGWRHLDIAAPLVTTCTALAGAWCPKGGKGGLGCARSRGGRVWWHNCMAELGTRLIYLPEGALPAADYWGTCTIEGSTYSSVSPAHNWVAQRVTGQNIDLAYIYRDLSS